MSLGAGADRTPAGRAAAATGRWPDLEDLRRARAAQAWLNRGRPSSDPAVARQVFVEYREAQRRWSRFDSWWAKALLAGFILVWAASLVVRANDGQAAGAAVAEAGLLGCLFFGWVLLPGSGPSRWGASRCVVRSGRESRPA